MFNTPTRRIASPRQGHEFLKSIGRTAIGLKFSEVTSTLTPLSSRVLGPGYWESGRPWPHAGDRAMNLLIQINWSEVTAAVGSENLASTGLNLPTQGITQIYLAPRHDFAGSDPQRPLDQTNWRLVHWDRVDASRCIKHPDAPGMIHPLFAATDSAGVSFHPEKQAANLTDGVEGLIEEDFAEGVHDEMMSSMTEVSRSQIAGFPFFFQADPRKHRIDN
jgi:uncharacterized protein YwqG